MRERGAVTRGRRVTRMRATRMPQYNIRSDKNACHKNAARLDEENIRLVLFCNVCLSQGKYTQYDTTLEKSIRICVWLRKFKYEGPACFCRSLVIDFEAHRLSISASVGSVFR